MPKKSSDWYYVCKLEGGGQYGVYKVFYPVKLLT